MRRLPFALIGLALAGCVAEPDVSETVQFAKKSDCEVYGCGSNSPEAEGKLFWTLHEKGQENDEFISIASLRKGSQPLVPDVVNGQLVGRSPTTNAILYSGAGIVGAHFTLKDSELSREYYVTITGAAMIRMWAQRPVGGTSTWSYELKYTSSVSGQERNLCNAAGGSTPGENPFNAILFDDDRIDTEKLAVSAQTPDWFSIGCAGSALAKLHLTGNTKAGSAIVGKTSTLDDRTAFLKMLTADYCGGGTPMTVAQMPLHYRDRYGHMSNTVTNEFVEGLWTKDGAVCVGKPRLEVHPDPVFGPSIAEELAAIGCTLPPACTPAQYATGYSYGSAYVMSTNY